MFRFLMVILFLIKLAGCSSKTENCSVKDPDLSGKYFGECLNGIANGEGESKGRDRYIGSFKSGSPHGKGSYKWGEGSEWDGDEYIGEFEHGERTYGVYKWRNGIVESGYFYKNKLRGVGSLLYPNEKLINKELIGKAKYDGLNYLISGYWIDGDLAFRCESEEDCGRVWVSAVNEIEEYIKSNSVTAKEREGVRYQITLKECLKKVHFKNEMIATFSHCMAEKDSIGFLPIYMMQRGEKIAELPLNAVKAGLAPKGGEVLTAGLGAYILGNLFITGGVNDFDPVMVKMDGIVAEQKFALMNKCEKQLFGCKLLVIGEVEELRPVTVIKAKFVVTYEDVESASRFSAQAKKYF